MAEDDSTHDGHGEPNWDEIALAGEWHSELESLYMGILLYSLCFLSQFSDNGIRSDVDRRWAQLWQDHFMAAHRRGLLVGAGYSSSREERLADPALQVQALWFDSLARAYANSGMPCDHCAGRGQFVCLCGQASLCSACENHSFLSRSPLTCRSPSCRSGSSSHAAA